MGNINGRPFGDVLREVEDGNLVADLTDKLYRLMAKVQEVHKAGSITLKLDITPTGKGMAEINAKITLKEPEDDRPGTTFFVGRDLSLTRRDPKQEVLFREVERPEDRPVRRVGNDD